MLQTMRNKIKGLVAFFLIGLLTIPLALVGVENLFNGNANSPEEVAEVEGIKITEREVQMALGRERQRLLGQFGEQLPAQLLSDENLRGSVIDGLVRRALLVNVAENGGMTFSTQQIDKDIVALPDFQQDGRFDSQRFLQIVRSLGHSPASFRELMKEDQAVNQIQTALLNTDFVTDTEIDRSVALSRQTRDFTWVSLPIGDLPNTVTVGDEEVSAYYDDNKGTYLTEEHVAVEYIELNIADLEKEITVADEDVLAQFEQELQSQEKPVEREAAHIMIEGGTDEAQANITLVQEKLAAGDDFAELASTYSDDFGSKDAGGNLGVSAGDVFPPAFEDALLTLEIGEVSPALEVDGNTHFIKLLAVSEQEVPKFEDEKVRITADLKRIQAEELFITEVEALRDLSYNAENLAEVASELGLSVAKTELFSRTTATTPLLQDPRVIEAAFSDRVLTEGFASDVLEVDPSKKALVVKLIQHQPIRTLSLEEKTVDIRQELALEKAKTAIAEQGVSIKEALTAGQSLAEIGEQEDLNISTQVAASRNAADVPSELLSHIFAMAPLDEEQRIDELHLNNGDFVIVSLSKITDGDATVLTEEERTSLRTNLANSIAGDEYRAWQDMLRAQADVEIFGGSYGSVEEDSSI